MSFELGNLFAGFVFGVIGVWLIRRARREASVPSLLIGLAMVIYPYFVESTLLVWAIGVGLAVLAYFIG